MESRSDIKTGDTQAVEVGVIRHEGREYASGGFWIDLERGRIVAYVSKAPEPFRQMIRLPGGIGVSRVVAYSLTTWKGEPLAPLVKTGESRGFYGVRLQHFQTTSPIAGFYWYGKGLGENMMLRLRKGRAA